MIEDAIAPDSYSGQYLNATMELLFIHLLRNHIEDFSLGRGSAKVDQNIQAILRYIQEHFTTVSLPEFFRDTHTYVLLCGDSIIVQEEEGIVECAANEKTPRLQRARV